MCFFVSYEENDENAPATNFIRLNTIAGEKSRGTISLAMMNVTKNFSMLMNSRVFSIIDALNNRIPIVAIEIVSRSKAKITEENAFESIVREIWVIISLNSRNSKELSEFK